VNTPYRRVRITTYVEFVVPVSPGLGVVGKDLSDALHIATEAWKKDHPRESLKDDSLHIFVGEDEIFIRYDIPNRED